MYHGERFNGISHLIGAALALAGQIFRKLDHVAIYLLIAGSYTPFTLVTLRGTWGWTLFVIIWGLAIAGIVVDSRHREGSRAIQMTSIC